MSLYTTFYEKTEHGNGWKIPEIKHPCHKNATWLRIILAITKAYEVRTTPGVLAMVK